MDFCLISVPFGHYDEPEILPYAINRLCPTGADVGQLTLLGDRSERRVWEKIGHRIFAALTPILFASLAQYREVSAASVARTIVALIGAGEPGCHVHRNDDLRRPAV